MSDEDRESTETVGEEVLDTSTDTDTSATTETEDELEEVAGNTNDSINASLDAIKDTDILKGMVTRLRHENGNHRRAKKELEKEVEGLKSWKRDNLKKVSEADARAAHADEVARQHIIKAAALEYDVDDDLIDLIDGKTVDEIWDKASRLANTKKEMRTYETPTDTTLFGGKSRGTPVGPQPKTAGTDFFEELMGRGPAPRGRK
jgi:hypothetical protein